MARTKLHHMKQARDEPIRAYGARLRGQASVCKFTKQCHGCREVLNYAEENVADALCRGIVDVDIQQDLLGERNQDITAEEMLLYIEAKEGGKRSAITLNPVYVKVEALSTYQRGNRTRDTAPSQAARALQPKCTYCGEPGHGERAPYTIRKGQCKAFGQTCTNCGNANHLAQMCRKGKRDHQIEPEPHTHGGIFDYTEDEYQDHMDPIC